MARPHTLTVADAATPPDVALRVDPSAAARASGMAGARAQWMPLAALREFAPAWQALAERALEPNVFYEPAFALPASEVFGHNAGAVLVWSPRDPARLIGLFPGRIERRRYGLGPAVLVGWTHPYAPLGVPLVCRDETAAALSAWLGYVAGATDTPGHVLLPYLPVDGPFATALRTALTERGGRSAAFGRHARALLAPEVDDTDYLEAALSAKKRKELRRQRRRLADHGAISIDTAGTPAEVSAALGAFLDLERKGWKGAAGTAAIADPNVHRFMRDAVGGLAARSQVRIMRLNRADETIATGIVLASGPAGWFWKIAYDESAAHASPGVQLALELTRSLADDPVLTHIDSCATPDHSMIDHLWRERLELADLLIAPDATAGAFALVRNFEHARRSAIAAAKWARNRLRGR